MRGAVKYVTVAAVAIAAIAVPSAASAQQCTLQNAPGVPPIFVEDACTKATEVFQFLAPQVGVALSGGNVMLGEGGALGGWGKRSAVLRVSAVDGRVPANDVSLSVNGAVSSDLGAERAPVPVPSLDVAIGVFRGVPLGLTNVGGVDLLLGVTMLPSVSRDRIDIKTDGGGIATNYGVRVGLLQESALVPGLGVSVMRRRLPTTSISFRSANDTLSISDTKVTGTSYRLTANKRFGLFALGGGIGQDQLDTRTSVGAIINETVSGVPVRGEAQLADLRDETNRNTAFVNVAFGLAMAQVVLEVGQSSAGTLRETVNVFGDRQANEAYRYGSVGIGIRF